jgi:hypothetical protein
MPPASDWKTQREDVRDNWSKTSPGLIDLISPKAGSEMNPAFFLFQDQSSGDKPKLSICVRNLAFMWICGNSRIQLAKVAHNTAVCVIRGRNFFSFLEAADSAAFAPELPIKETALEQLPH